MKPDGRDRIVEFRRYILVPGQRAVLIDLFDRVFTAAQEELGIHVVGSFRDVGDDDAFVWVRSFASADSRVAALSAFYYGPVWTQHREVANATMVDSDDVLLCEPVATFDALPVFGGGRIDGPGRSMIEAVTMPIDDVDGVAARAHAVMDSMVAGGAQPVTILESGGLHNGFPALPVRDDATVTWLTRFDTQDEFERYRTALPLDQILTTAFPELRSNIADVRRLALSPTRSSQLV